MRSPPSTRRGRATLERILDAACDLYYRQGVTATGLLQIVEASQTGKGQIYHYFASKDELTLAVIDRQVARILEAQRPFVDRMATAADLRAWAADLVGWYEPADRPPRCPLGALVVETDPDPAARAALAVGFLRWRDALATGLRRIEGRTAAVDGPSSERYADLLLAAYQGGVIMSNVRGNLDPLRTALAAAVDDVLEPAFPAA